VTQYRRVTNGRTDILPRHSPRYAYAWRGKNRCWTLSNKALSLTLLSNIPSAFSQQPYTVDARRSRIFYRNSYIYIWWLCASSFAETTFQTETEDMPNSSHLLLGPIKVVRYGSSSSLNVIKIDTNRKPMCNLLIVFHIPTTVFNFSETVHVQDRRSYNFDKLQRQIRRSYLLLQTVHVHRLLHSCANNTMLCRRWYKIAYSFDMSDMTNTIGISLKTKI